MYISAFTIAGFGRLHPQAVEGLAPGLNIFLGENEAGKSTSLEFFRTMLLGYPLKKPKEHFPPLYGDADGGSLILRENSPGAPFSGSLTLARQPGRTVLTGTDGTMLDESMLPRLFGGVTRTLYQHLYGFSLSELHYLSTLHEDEIRHTLYGASFGLGSRPPSQVLDTLKVAISEIFARKSTKKQRGALASQAGKASTVENGKVWLKLLKETQQSLVRSQQDAPRYDALQEELERLKHQHENLCAQRIKHARELEHDNRLIKAWDNWEKLLQAEARLHAAPMEAGQKEGHEHAASRTMPIIQDFPADAVPRLNIIVERLNQHRATHAAAQAKCGQLRQRMEALPLYPQMAALLDEARALAESRGSYADCRADLPVRMSEYEHLCAEIDRTRSVLGPDWSMENIAAFDRSLFTLEDIARHENALRTAAELSAHTDALAKNAAKLANDAARAHAHARDEARKSALTEQENSLVRIPVEMVERIRGLHSAAGLAVAELPARRKDAGHLEADLTAALADISPEWTARMLDTDQHSADEDSSATSSTDHILVSRTLRHEFLQCAESALRASDAAEKCRDKHAAEQSRLEDSENRLERLNARMGDTPLDPRLIDERARLLADIRRMPSECRSAEERLERTIIELETHRENRPMASSLGGLITIGVVLAVLAVSGFIPALFDGTGLYPGADALDGLARNAPVLLPIYNFLLSLSPGLFLAFSALLVLGLGLCWLGRPTIKADRRSEYEERLARLEAEHADAAKRAAEAESEYTRLRDEAHLPDTDEFTLRRAEAALDQDRAETARQELLRASIAEMEDEYDEAKKRLHSRAADLDEARRQEQQTLSAWMDMLAVLKLPRDIRPQNAANIQERIRAARQSAQRLSAERALISGHEAALHRLADMLEQAQSPAQTIPGHSHTPDSPVCDPLSLRSLPPDSLLHTAALWLAAVNRAQNRRADAEQREAVCRAAAEQAERLQTDATQARQHAAAAVQQAAQARTAWKQWLDHSGLQRGHDTPLTPETARNALETMKDCLRLNDDAHALATRITTIKTAIEKFEHSLTALLARVSTTLSPGTDPGTRLLQLIQAAQNAKEAQDEYKRLDGQLAEAQLEQEQTLRAMREAEDELTQLFISGDSADEEDFRRRAALFAEQEDIRRTICDQMALLRAGMGMDSDEAVRSLFTRSDKPALESGLLEKSARLARFEEEERELLAAKARLEHERKILPGNTELADLRQKEAGLIEDISREVRNWVRLSLARYLVDEAKNRFERERQPEVIRLAGELFAEITGQRWRGVSASLDDAKSLLVLDQNNMTIDHSALSRGAQEQLYLALRLAYLQHHARRNWPLPLIMDDILVNFDPDRTRRAARILARTAHGFTPDGEAENTVPAQQILFFTCHPGMAETLRSEAPDAAQFIVTDGRIDAA